MGRRRSRRIFDLTARRASDGAGAKRPTAPCGDAFGQRRRRAGGSGLAARAALAPEPPRRLAAVPSLPRVIPDPDPGSTARAAPPSANGSRARLRPPARQAPGDGSLGRARGDAGETEDTDPEADEHRSIVRLNDGQPRLPVKALPPRDLSVRAVCEHGEWASGLGPRRPLPSACRCPVRCLLDRSRERARRLTTESSEAIHHLLL